MNISYIKKNINDNSGVTLVVIVMVILIATIILSIITFGIYKNDSLLKITEKAEINYIDNNIKEKMQKEYESFKLDILNDERFEKSKVESYSNTDIVNKVTEIITEKGYNLIIENDYLMYQYQKNGINHKEKVDKNNIYEIVKGIMEKK